MDKLNILDEQQTTKEYMSVNKLAIEMADLTKNNKMLEYNKMMAQKKLNLRRTNNTNRKRIGLNDYGPYSSPINQKKHPSNSNNNSDESSERNQMEKKDKKLSFNVIEQVKKATSLRKSVLISTLSPNNNIVQTSSTGNSPTNKQRQTIGPSSKNKDNQAIVMNFTSLAGNLSLDEEEDEEQNSLFDDNWTDNTSKNTKKKKKSIYERETMNLERKHAYCDELRRRKGENLMKEMQSQPVINEISKMITENSTIDPIYERANLLHSMKQTKIRTHENRKEMIMMIHANQEKQYMMKIRNQKKKYNKEAWGKFVKEQFQWNNNIKYKKKACHIAEIKNMNQTMFKPTINNKSKKYAQYAYARQYKGSTDHLNKTMIHDKLYQEKDILQESHEQLVERYTPSFRPFTNKSKRSSFISSVVCHTTASSPIRGKDTLWNGVYKKYDDSKNTTIAYNITTGNTRRNSFKEDDKDRILTNITQTRPTEQSVDNKSIKTNKYIRRIIEDPLEDEKNDLRDYMFIEKQYLKDKELQQKKPDESTMKKKIKGSYDKVVMRNLSNNNNNKDSEKVTINNSIGNKTGTFHNQSQKEISNTITTKKSLRTNNSFDYKDTENLYKININNNTIHGFNPDVILPSSKQFKLFLTKRKNTNIIY